MFFYKIIRFYIFMFHRCLKLNDEIGLWCNKPWEQLYNVRVTVALRYRWYVAITELYILRFWEYVTKIYDVHFQVQPTLFQFI